MNKSRRLSTASLASLMLVLAACGSEQQPPTQPDASADTPYSRELDKARSVEGTLQQQKENLDRTLQENENPTAE